MDLLFGNALSRVLQDVIQTVFKIDVCLVERRCEDNSNAPFEVSGIIGFTGSTQGSIIVSFPMDLARQLAAMMLGEEHSEQCSPQDIADSVGELTNIVAGNLLVMIEHQAGATSQMSLPNVVMGAHRIVWGSKDHPHDQLVFRSSMGLFAAETNLRTVTVLQ